MESDGTVTLRLNGVVRHVVGPGVLHDVLCLIELVIEDVLRLNSVFSPAFSQALSRSYTQSFAETASRWEAGLSCQTSHQKATFYTFSMLSWVYTSQVVFPSFVFCRRRNLSARWDDLLRLSWFLCETRITVPRPFLVVLSLPDVVRLNRFDKTRNADSFDSYHDGDTHCIL